jgi:glutamate--cysteine ligase
MIVAQAAFWVGLLYDEAGLAAAWDIAKAWSDSERECLRAMVPRLGLATPIAGRSLGTVAAEALAIARKGLEARGRRDEQGRDETHYLQPLEGIVASGRSRAEDRLADYEGPWRRTVEPAFTECVF